MTERLYLSDQQMGEYFCQANAVQPGASPIDLEPRVQSWLERANMAHRSALAIAVEVAKLKPEPAPIPTPEEAAWRQNQVDGIGNAPPLSADDRLAAEVASWDLATYSRQRGRLGLHKDTYTFLSGGN
jgi:hypothetical protein